MPGPVPKPDSIRRRNNKRSTRAILPADGAALDVAPRLPTHPEKKAWHPLAKQFWLDVWRSPMATQYVDADVHGLTRMLVLTDEFWRKPSVMVSAELRMLSQSYGLSPIDRRRLEWTIARAEDAVSENERKRVKRAKVIDDPREVLDQ